MKVSVYMLDISCFHWERPENREQMELLIHRLSASRQAKIRAYRFDEARRLSLAAGLLLDYGLGEYGLRERDMRVEAGPWGKPRFYDRPDIHFNLSHSGTVAMAAFADCEVGCDVERMAALREKVAARFFSPRENAALRQCPDEESRRELFYRIWTRKESYIKYTGEGMHRELSGFSVVIPEGDFTGGAASDVPPCTFRDFPVPGYQAAVCLPREDGDEPLFCSFQNLQDVV